MIKSVIKWDEGKQSINVERQPNGELRVTGATGTVCIPPVAIRQTLETLYYASLNQEPPHHWKEAPNHMDVWHDVELEMLKRDYGVLKETAIYLLAAQFDRTTEAIEWQLRIKP